MILSLLIGALFVTTAVGKAVNPDPVEETLSTLFGASWHARYWLVILLVACELALGFLFLSGVRPRLVAAVGGVTLVFFSAVIIALLFTPNAPACGCGGAASSAEDPQVENAISLARNVILLSCCAYLMRADAARSAPE